MSKYIDLKGQVGGTPYGIKVTVFISDRELDKCRVFRESFKTQKATVQGAKREDIDESHVVFEVDHTRE